MLIRKAELTDIPVLARIESELGRTDDYSHEELEFIVHEGWTG